MKIPKFKLLNKDKNKEKADKQKVKKKEQPKSAVSPKKTAKAPAKNSSKASKKEKPKLLNKITARKKDKDNKVYKSVKTRTKRPFFNKTFGASARADFEVDKFR